MGFFSFTCAVCEHDMMHGPNPGYSKYTRGIVFFPDGDRVSGEYDGYGRLGPINLADIDSGLGLGGNPNALRGCSYKLVHEACRTKDMTFENIEGSTTHGRNQGFWPGERIAQDRWGPPDLSEITQKSTYVCFQCHRVWDAKWAAGVCPFGCERPEDSSEDAETVSSFSYRRGSMTNALAICRNPSYVFKPHYPGKAREATNCWYYGIKQLIVGKLSPEAEEWEREKAEADGRAFDWKPSCPGCKSSEHLEMFKLIRSPLEHLAAI